MVQLHGPWSEPVLSVALVLMCHKSHINIQTCQNPCNVLLQVNEVSCHDDNCYVCYDIIHPHNHAFMINHAANGVYISGERC
jgi:hypothetical protein